MRTAPHLVRKPHDRNGQAVTVTDSSNAERFVNAYNRVDQILGGKQSGNKYVPFVDRVRASKLLIASQKDLLLDYAKLRNVILHTTGSYTGNPIADPRTQVVETFEKIADQLENPPRVFSLMKNQVVDVLDEESDTAMFLDLVKAHNYSQAPVRMSDGSLSLVTTNAVSRWLASEYTASSGAAIEHATLGEVLNYAEAEDSIVVRSRDFTVVQAWRLFAGLENLAPPHTLAITHSGKASEKILCLVVRFDLPQLIRALV